MFHYFGYGSNMSLTSLRAKGVEPQRSVPAALPGWRLRFNVRHFFRHEGGMGNIEASPDPSDRVLGVLHQCRDEDLSALDAMEAYGTGYDRVAVEVMADDRPVRALAYVGLPAHLDDGCRPTRRYLNILLQGAEAAGLDPAYVAALRRQTTHPERDYPPFRHPETAGPVFDREALARHPLYTALWGAVFDMAGARPEHAYLRTFFGGKDMTLFHLKRLDTSDGSETWDDVRAGRISEAGRRYLNAYLHEYDVEYRYVGRIVYD